MPQNGYWIECIPVSAGDKRDQEGQNFGADDNLYSAMISSIPEARVFATTPDKAIQELRDKLKSLRHEYCRQGKAFPDHDNPVRPPRNMGSVRGWISVYVQAAECCKNMQ